MSIADERRARLGQAAVDAARQSARAARPPGRTLWDSITVLLGGRRLVRPDREAERDPRDAA